MSAVKALQEAMRPEWVEVEGGGKRNRFPTADEVEGRLRAAGYHIVSLFGPFPAMQEEELPKVHVTPIDTAAEWADWHAEQVRSTQPPVSHEVERPDSGNEHRYCVPHDHADPSHDPDARFTTAVKQAVSVNPHRDEHGNVIENYHMCGCQRRSRPTVHARITSARRTPTRCRD